MATINTVLGPVTMPQFMETAQSPTTASWYDISGMNPEDPAPNWSPFRSGIIGANAEKARSAGYDVDPNNLSPWQMFGFNNPGYEAPKPEGGLFGMLDKVIPDSLGGALLFMLASGMGLNAFAGAGAAGAAGGTDLGVGLFRPEIAAINAASTPFNLNTLAATASSVGGGVGSGGALMPPAVVDPAVAGFTPTGATLPSGAPVLGPATGFGAGTSLNTGLFRPEVTSLNAATTPFDLSALTGVPEAIGGGASFLSPEMTNLIPQTGANLSFPGSASGFTPVSGGGFMPSGASSALGSGGLPPGGFSELLERLKKMMKPNALSGAMGILSGLYGLNQSNQLTKLGQQAMERSDPFGPYRKQYGDQLSALMADPSSISKYPGYQAGLDAITRKMASQGYLGSGNMMAALQKYGGDFFDKEATRLGQFAGAQFGPNTSAALSGATAGSDLASRALASLGYGAMNFGFRGV